MMNVKIICTAVAAVAAVGIWWWMRGDPDGGYVFRARFNAIQERICTVDGIEWHYGVADGKAVLVKAVRCGSQATEFALPSKLDGFPVTVVVGSVFRKDDPVRSLTIPEGVTDIALHAFSGVGVETLALPSSVTNLSVFNVVSCKKFIVSPDNPKYCSMNGMLCSRDGKVLLHGIGGDVRVPDGVERIDDGAFWHRSLVSVKLPDSVREIGCMAFLECGELRKVNLSPKVRNIAAWTFYGCTNLESVVIPSCVTNIDAYAFEGCKRLKEVAIPEGVVEIGHHAFANCESLESVTIPPSVKVIGDKAFSSCKNLSLCP